MVTLTNLGPRLIQDVLTGRPQFRQRWKLAFQQVGNQARCFDSKLSRRHASFAIDGIVSSFQKDANTMV